jgi:hypothetical protein
LRVCDVGHGQDARQHRRIDPRRRQLVAEAEERFGFEEELADRARGAGIELALEVVDIRLDAGRIRVAFRIGRDRNLERRDRLQPATSSAALA